MMIVSAVGLAAAVCASGVGEGRGSVPRMSKEELKGMMGSPDLFLLDVRQGRDWEGSEFKIKGAERRDPGKFNEWKDQLPKDKTIVLYCA